jgi:hypothetical protein
MFLELSAFGFLFLAVQRMLSYRSTRHAGTQTVTLSHDVSLQTNDFLTLNEQLLRAHDILFTHDHDVASDFMSIVSDSE